MIVIPAKALHHVVYRAKARLGARALASRRSRGKPTGKPGPESSVLRRL